MAFNTVDTFLVRFRAWRCLFVLEFRFGETSFGGLISFDRFLPIYLFEKAYNFDAVRELFDKVFARIPFYSLVDLQDVINVEIGIGLFDNVQKRSCGIDISCNRSDFELFRLLDCRFPVG